MAATITVQKGDDASIQLDFTNPDGTAYNATGSTLTFTVLKQSGATPVITKTVTSFTVSGSRATVALTAANLTIAVRAWRYELALVDGSGNRRTSGLNVFYVTENEGQASTVSVVVGSSSVTVAVTVTPAVPVDGVPIGGTTDQVLAKASNADLDVEWVDQSGGAAVTSVAGRTGNVTLTKTDVGLPQVDNTPDASKPVSTATQAALNLKAATTYVDSQDSAEAVARAAADSALTTAVAGKEPTITVGTTAQYWRGDKSFQTLNQDAVPDGSTNKAYSAADKTRLANTSGTNTGDQTLPVGGTPALTLGTTNSAGSSPNFLRRDDTILAFDATAPSTQAFGDSATVGVATVAARRDHKHAMPTTTKDTTANTGLLKGNGSVVSAAAAGTDYLAPAAIGTTVQAFDADLSTIAGLTATTDSFLQAKASAWASRTPTQVTADLIAMVGDSGSGGSKGLVPAPTTGDATKFLKGNGTWASIPGGGDALVANPLSQFAATTSAQLAGVISDETGSGALVFGTSPSITTPTGIVKADVGLPLADNTADASKNVLTATKWTTARNLAGNSVDGSAAVVFANKFIVQGVADTGLSAAQFLGALSTGILKVTTTTGVLSTAIAADFPTLNQSTTGSAATLTTPRAINGTNFDGSAAITITAAAGTLTGTTLNSTVVSTSITGLGTISSGVWNGTIITSAYGGTGNGFTKFTGPTTSEKTFTLPDASATVLTSNTPVTIAQGGSGRATSSVAYGLLAAGTTTSSSHQTISPGTTGQILKSNGASALATFQTGAPADVQLGNVDNTSNATERAATRTLTNARITKRTGTTTSSATPTINTDSVDFYSLTAQAVDITSMTTNLSGTPTEGQTLWLAITGTAARAITWGTSFEASTVALPTTTVTTNRLDVGFAWNTVSSKWRCVAVA